MKKFEDEYDLEEIKRKLFDHEPKMVQARNFFMQHEPRYCEFAIKMRILLNYPQQMQEEFDKALAAAKAKEAKEDEIYGEVADLLGLPRCIGPLVLAYTGYCYNMLDYEGVAKKLFYRPIDVAKRYIYEVRKRFIAAFGSDR